MTTTVRFVTDTEPYEGADDECMAKIASGDLIVVGMVVFDDEKVEAEEAAGVARETAVFHHCIDSLWGICVDRAAIDDSDKDITDASVVRDEYLRSLAEEALA